MNNCTNVYLNIGSRKNIAIHFITFIIIIFFHVDTDIAIGQDRYEKLGNFIKRERLLKSGQAVPELNRVDMMNEPSELMPMGITQDILNVTKLGHWTDGPCWAMDIDGFLAYFQNGTALEIVDFSNPGSPVEKSKTVLPARIRAIKVVGDYAYISYTTSSEPYGGPEVSIFDISDPASPVEAGRIDQVRSAWRIDASEDHLYLSSASFGDVDLRVFDISNPVNPVALGTLGIDGHILDIIIREPYIYATLRYEGMAVIDISDPTQPQELSRLGLEGECEALDFMDDMVFVSSFAYNFYAIDVSNPSSPWKVDSTSCRGVDIDIRGDYAFIANWGDGLQVFDISDPHNMHEVGFLEIHWQTDEIIVKDSRAYMANGRQGLRVYDISDPTAPSELGYFDTADQAQGVAADDSYAYVADEADGLYILDIRVPSNPAVIGHLEIENSDYDIERDVMDVEIRGDYAFLATILGLYVIDISNPFSPVEVGNSQAAGYNRETRLTIQGDRLYWAGVSSGCFIMDISNPASPQVLGSIDPEYGIYDVAVNGNYAFVADADSGVRCIDISDPASPVEIGRFEDVDLVLGLDISGSLVYAADWYEGLRIIDVSDPTRPVQVGQVKSSKGNSAREVVVDGQYAYVANGYYELLVVNVLDPSNPIIAGYYETIDDPVDVYVHDDKIYLADESGGVFILEFTPQIDDSTPPYTSEHDPPKNAVNVLLNTNITVHIKDDTSGVNQSTIMMKVDGSTVTPAISGTPFDYTVTYDTPTDFDYNQTVTVSIDASDMVGNAMQTETYSFSTQRSSDITPPTITIQGSVSGTKGTDMDVTASVADNTQVEWVTLYYRMGGAEKYGSIGMTDSGGGMVTGSVPAESVTERGVEYYISAADTAGNISHSPADDYQSSPHSVQVTFSRLDCPYQTPANSYRMISVPADITSKQPASVLPDDLGNHDRAEWRLIRDEAETYVEYGVGSISHFQQGYGFWLITKEAKNWNVGSGRSTSTAGSYTMTLTPGWNQIGNPFAFPVNWSDVEIEEGKNVEPPIGYEGTGNSTSGYQYNQSQLMSWKGYYVKNLESSSVTIGLPPTAATASAKKGGGPLDWVLDKNDWVVRIHARSGRVTDLDNYIGCLSGAEDAWDRHDFSEVPPFGEFVSLSFPHEDWERYPGRYAGDFRSNQSEGQVWDFEVETNVKDSEVVLSLKNIDRVPEDFAMKLIDRDLKISRDLRKSAEYRFFSGPDETVRHFRMIAGSEAFTESHDEGLGPAPETFRLHQNYPNPFNASTHIQYQLPEASRVDIRIFASSGKEIRRLLENRDRSAGYHTALWDGRDAQGRHVASGIYVCALRAGKFEKAIKMLMVR